jgi:hypothetical protein
MEKKTDERREKSLLDATLKIIKEPEVNYSEELSRALRPFARMSRPEDADYPEGVICTQGEYAITYGDLAKAKEALSLYIRSKKR